ncbi:MAG: hypothetical protein KF778_07530 [Rhodocyclaceae bacterium]|nr:hypothetical protein [Rhodocyclaceae bacterium]MBX3668242.1 hypothetical protein [Rhodocyclaceae bacterium]
MKRARPLRLRWLLALLMAVVTLPALARDTFCCSDKDGRQVCGDQLPEACLTRTYRVIDERGNVRKVVERALTAEERARRDEEVRRRAEAERQEQERKRKYRAILSTYASVDEIDISRNRAVTDLKASLAALEGRLEESIKKRKTLSNEAEFYRSKPMPDELRSQILLNEAEIKGHQETVDAKRKEIDATSAKYEEEKAMFREAQRASGAAANLH